MRRPYLKQRWPDNWLEIHPIDAKRRGIESGDRVVISHNKIPVEVGGYSKSAQDTKVRGVIPLQASNDIVEQDPLQQLIDDDYRGSKGIHAKTIGNQDIVEQDPLLGLLGDRQTQAASTSRRTKRRRTAGSQQEVDDPISQRPRYKIARGVIRKIGESEYKHSLSEMSFKSRSIV